MTLRRQKQPALVAPSSSTTASGVRGEKSVASSYDSSAALATAITPAATSGRPAAELQHPFQSVSPGETGRNRGVENQADKGPGTDDRDGGRIRHTAPDGHSKRKGRGLNGPELHGTQQVDTSSRGFGPRLVVSGDSGGMAGGPSGMASRTTERRLPRIILKVTPPPEAEAGTGLR
jgi:hypothetical protein